MENLKHDAFQESLKQFKPIAKQAEFIPTEKQPKIGILTPKNLESLNELNKNSSIYCHNANYTLSIKACNYHVNKMKNEFKLLKEYIMEYRKFQIEGLKDSIDTDDDYNDYDKFNADYENFNDVIIFLDDIKHTMDLFNKSIKEYLDNYENLH